METTNPEPAQSGSDVDDMRPTGLVVEWINDDLAVISFIRTKYLLACWRCDYDLYGRAGMDEALQMVTKMAKMMGLTVQVVGTPGV